MEKNHGIEAEVLVPLYWHAVAGVGGATVGLRWELGSVQNRTEENEGKRGLEGIWLQRNLEES
jgi:hypothetical protein